MKTSFIVTSNSDFADYVSFARQERIDGVELMYTAPKADAFSDAAQRKRILQDNGVQLSAFAIWQLGLADPPASGSADILRRGIDMAAELGATCFFTGTGEPQGNDPVGALADCYAAWAERVQQAGMSLAVYLGHKGSFINSEQRLGETVARIPQIGLKLDPVGIIRNLKSDPCHVLYKYGRNLTFFHVKGLLRLPAGELEPPPGMDELPWPSMFGILHQYGYQGYVSVEPHGPYWASPDAHRKRYVQLTLKALATFL